MDLATTVLHDIQYLRSHYYYFLGKLESWGEIDLAPDVAQDDSTSENFLIRSNALYFKKIGQNDVSLVCKKYVWQSGLIFENWDHTLDMSDEMFYCMNSEFNVYKCLDNNAAAQSTVEPTGTSFKQFRTADGYMWKYMYTIPTFKRTKFLSLAYMPVQKALSDSFYNKGSVDDVAVINGGTGYADQLLTFIVVENNAVGSGASVSMTVNALTGEIQTVSVVSGGTGYTHGADIRVTTSTGYGAVLTPTFSGGVLQSVAVTEGGLGYQAGDVISVVINSAVLVPVVSRETGQIVDVRVIDSGAGYNYADPPTLTVNVEVGQTIGSALYQGNTGAVIEAVVSNGKITRCLIRDPGQDYPADTSTTITVSGDGEDAVFTPVVYQGQIIDVIVENAGIGYTYIQLDVVGAGTGGLLRGITSVSDYQSDQSIVEQTTIPGAIFSVKVTEPGTYYTQATTVSITGDGVGAEASIVIDGGVVTKIIITEPGRDYTYASILITDPNRVSAPNDAVDAVAYAIFPPRGGHGYNAVDELFGNTVSFNSLLKLENGLAEIDVEQEFRQYGIIKNPTYLSSGNTFTADNDMVAFTVQLQSTVGLVEDEILIQTGVRYRVVSFDAGTNTAILQKLGSANAAISSLVAETDSNRIYGVVQTLSYPVIDKYSGRMLYISNESPFIIGPGQSIAVKTFLKL